jgi:hypothetical protein
VSAPKPGAIGPSSIARIAGNILSGFASMPGRMISEPTNNAWANESLRLARYIAEKAEAPGGESHVPELLAALKALRIDANRLCDRSLGGTYEDDCRRAIAGADAAIAKAEGRS